jgi:hypothetical protein
MKAFLVARESTTAFEAMLADAFSKCARIDRALAVEAGAATLSKIIMRSRRDA